MAARPGGLNDVGTSHRIPWPGLPAVNGEVRIKRASAHHADRTWSATAALHVGSREVVVLAEEATGRELVDELQDRLGRPTDKAVRAGHNDRLPVCPPCRGDSGTRHTAAGSADAPDSHPA